MRVILNDGREATIRIQYDRDYHNPRRTTAASVTLGSLHGIGMAVTSVQDKFDKRVGRELAIARAMDNAKFTEHEAAQVWKSLLLDGFKLV